jgi:hypothetical protein
MDRASVGACVYRTALMKNNRLDEADNVATRVLLAQMLLAMRRVRPDLIGEFREKVTALQQKKPLKDLVHGVMQKILDEALAG